MFKSRFVFNIVGKKNLVDKASIEIKNIISESTKESVDIIMEDKTTIYNRISGNKNCYINKCYINDDNTDTDSNKIVELSRYIRSRSRDTIHPWNLHVEEVDSRYVSDFMKNCSQINSVYPLNASDHDKKANIDIYLRA